MRSAASGGRSLCHCPSAESRPGWGGAGGGGSLSSQLDAWCLRRTGLSQSSVVSFWLVGAGERGHTAEQPRRAWLVYTQRSSLQTASWQSPRAAPPCASVEKPRLAPAIVYVSLQCK